MGPGPWMMKFSKRSSDPSVVEIRRLGIGNGVRSWYIYIYISEDMWFFLVNDVMVA